MSLDRGGSAADVTEFKLGPINSRLRAPKAARDAPQFPFAMGTVATDYNYGFKRPAASRRL